MQPVVICTKYSCPFAMRRRTCSTRRAWPTRKSPSTATARSRRRWRKRSGRSTVPQIFIGGAHVGGCDDLFDLDPQGKLDGLLAGWNHDPLRAGLRTSPTNSKLVSRRRRLRSAGQPRARYLSGL